MGDQEESNNYIQHLNKEMQSSIEEKDEKIAFLEADLRTASDQISKLVVKIQELTSESLKMISLSVYEEEINKLTYRAKEAEEKAIQMHNELVNSRKTQETACEMKDFSCVTQEFTRINIENPPSPIEPLNASMIGSSPMTGFESDWSSTDSMVSASALTPNTSFTESTETSTPSTPELNSPSNAPINISTPADTAKTPTNVKSPVSPSSKSDPSAGAAKKRKKKKKKKKKKKS